MGSEFYHLNPITRQKITRKTNASGPYCAVPAKTIPPVSKALGSLVFRLLPCVKPTAVQTSSNG